MAIDFLNNKTIKRSPTSADQITVYTDGYKDDFSNTTDTTIADIISNSGIITLSNVYVPGKRNLMVIVDGLMLIDEGIDYTELNDQQIQLSGTVLSGLNSTTSRIRVMWNRPLPGARDQLLNNLRDVTPDLASAIKDDNTLRAALANTTNPLATLADIAASPTGFNIAGAVRVSPSSSYTYSFPAASKAIVFASGVDLSSNDNNSIFGVAAIDLNANSGSSIAGDRRGAVGANEMPLPILTQWSGRSVVNSASPTSVSISNNNTVYESVYSLITF